MATKVVLDSEAPTSIDIAQQLGENQYNKFVCDRINDNQESSITSYEKINYAYSNKRAS